MGGCCLEGFRRFAPDMELEGCSKEERRLEEKERGSHAPKTGRSNTEKEEIEKKRKRQVACNQHYSVLQMKEVPLHSLSSNKCRNKI